MYFRAFIREGDSLTPGGGRVQPKPQQFSIKQDGKNSCFEGDPVYCNVCKNWGVTKCVPPYRKHTGPDGRQANLDGDLCICKCPVPPRLKASSNSSRMSFQGYEMAGAAGASGWMSYAGHSSASATKEKQITLLHWSYGDELTPLKDVSRHGSDMNLHVKTENYATGDAVTVTLGSDSGVPLLYQGDETITLTGKVDANGDVIFRNVFKGKTVNLEQWGE